MQDIDLKLICPNSQIPVGTFVNDRFILNNNLLPNSSKFKSIKGVPNMRINLEEDEKLDLTKESKSLPRQNSSQLNIPFLHEALGSDELVLELGAGVEVCKHPKLIKTDAYLYSTDLHCLADAHSLPFEDNTFGYVYSLAVFEHLHSPWIAAEEIYRVLKPGGKAFTLTAFMQHMHGYPHHYFNMTTSGLKRIFNSFEIVNCEPSRHSNISEIAYIICDLKNVLNFHLKKNEGSGKELSGLNQAVEKFCENVVLLNEPLMQNLDNGNSEFSKIAPAIEITVKKPF